MMTVPPTRTFSVIAELLARRAGLEFRPEKAYLVQARLRSLAQRLGLADVEGFADYLASAPNREPVEVEIVEAMLNNETFFFRDRIPFEMLAHTLLPRLKAARAVRRRLRIWCAACSTGQEPYSIAMLFQEAAASWAGWQIDIVATDLSTRVLERAKSGLYSQFEVQRGLSIERLLHHFQKVGEFWQLSENVRRRVSFEPFNLAQNRPVDGAYDIILCRNVLMYLSAAEKAAALAKLRRALATDGSFLLGAAETVFGASEDFYPDPGARGFYITREAAGPDSPRIMFRRPAA